MGDGAFSPEALDADLGAALAAAAGGFFPAAFLGGAASPTPLTVSATPTASAPNRRNAFMRTPAIEGTTEGRRALLE
jgi:hypothetical protein